MTFSTGYLGDPVEIKAGELKGDNNIVLSAKTFEDSLKIGRFAKLDSGSLDNIDASATPVIAGVVTRNQARAVEDADVIDSEYYEYAEYLRSGLITVDVVTGDTPAAFGQVYVENQTPADYGKATTTSTGNAQARAEFIEEVQTDVWLVRLY